MLHNELNPPFAENPTIQSSICARCGKAADVHLAMLGDVPQRSESFCLSCGEAHLHDLRSAVFEHAEVMPPSFTGPSAKHFSHDEAHVDEVEGGIIFWEGHGWSSDGPFAGA
jgi:hypothetical protein